MIVKMILDNISNPTSLDLTRFSYSIYLTETFFENYIHLPWNWDYVIRNKNVSLEFIERHMEKFEPFLDSVVVNENVTWEFLQKHKIEVVDWSSLSLQIQYSDIFENPEQPWEPLDVSTRRDIPLDVIEANIEFPWHWPTVMYCRRDLTVEFIEKYIVPNITAEEIEEADSPIAELLSFSTDPEIYKYFERIVMGEIVNVFTGQVRLYDLSFNRHFQFSVIENYIELNGVDDMINDEMLWFCVSEHANVTLDIVNRTMDKFDWNWKGLVSNPNLTMEFIKTHLHKFDDSDRYWELITANKGITIEMIQTNIDLPWDWKMISSLKELSMEFIDEHHTKIDFANLSYNPHLTDDIIDKYIDEKWIWDKIYVRYGVEITKYNYERFVKYSDKMNFDYLM